MIEIIISLQIHTYVTICQSTPVTMAHRPVYFASGKKTVSVQGSLTARSVADPLFEPPRYQNKWENLQSHYVPLALSNAFQAELQCKASTVSPVTLHSSPAIFHVQESSDFEPYNNPLTTTSRNMCSSSDIIWRRESRQWRAHCANCA